MFENIIFIGKVFIEFIYIIFPFVLLILAMILTWLILRSSYELTKDLIKERKGKY